MVIFFRCPLPPPRKRTLDEDDLSLGDRVTCWRRVLIPTFPRTERTSAFGCVQSTNQVKTKLVANFEKPDNIISNGRRIAVFFNNRRHSPRNALSYAIVNLKPIVPGHVLVIPTRPVKRLVDLSPEEVTSLFSTVQEVGKVVEEAYKADALTLACQDGKAAGQSIPHVHIHILPRRFKGDQFENDNDRIYPALEKSESGLPRDFQTIQEQKYEALKVDADENRPPRTVDEMEKEATWLQSLFLSN